MKHAILGLLLALAMTQGARADIAVPSDGSDGVFNPTKSVTIDLGKAPTGKWDDPATTAGLGVYDPAQWAVVFKYDSVNIPSGVTVSFTNNVAKAPVVWLVKNNVTIAGTVNLRGQDGGEFDAITEPGPGGFFGGIRPRGQTPGMAGGGPGGGYPIMSGCAGSAGSYATSGLTNVNDFAAPTYGNVQILPLIGGSGGGAYYGFYGYSCSGAAGGGAILISACKALTLQGAIDASGGYDSYGYSGSSGYGRGGGSGGAIRLVADVLNGTMLNLSANSRGTGGNGRIRLEANTNNLTAISNPSASVVLPANPPQIWPPDTGPKITAITLNGVPIPADRKAGMTVSGVDVNIPSTGNKDLVLSATNIPASAKVVVRINCVGGQMSEVNATMTGGNQAASTWKATLNVQSGVSVVYARVVF